MSGVVGVAGTLSATSVATPAERHVPTDLANARGWRFALSNHFTTNDMPRHNFVSDVTAMRFTSASVERDATTPTERAAARVAVTVRNPANPHQVALRDLARVHLGKHDVYKSVLPRERRNSFTLPDTRIDERTGVSEAVSSMMYHVFGTTTLQDGNRFLHEIAIPRPLDNLSVRKALEFGLPHLVDLKFAMNVKGLGHVIFGSKPFIFLDDGEPGHAALRKLKADGNLDTQKFAIVEHEGSIGLLSLKAQGLPGLVEKYKPFFIAAMRLPDNTTSDFVVRSLSTHIGAILGTNSPVSDVVLGVLLGLGKDSAFAWTRNQLGMDQAANPGFGEMDDLVEEIQHELSDERHALPSIPLLTMDKGPETKQLIDNYGIESTLIVKRWQLLNCRPEMGTDEAVQRVKDQTQSLYAEQYDTEQLRLFGMSERNCHIAGADALRELTV